jgi:Penicillin-binding protein 5, C-terminal domain
MALMNYGYGNFRNWTPLRADQVVAHPTVKDRPGLHVPVYAAGTFTRVLARDSHVRIRVDVPARLDGPLPRGAVVGSAKVVDDGRVIKSVPVVLRRTLAAVSGLTLAARAVTKPLPLALIAIVVALALLAVALLARRRRRPSTDSGSDPRTDSDSDTGSGGRTRDSEWEVA